MGLYLCIFDDDVELDGVEVGSYSDFEVFRAAVEKHVEDGARGSKCPILTLHADSDGQWSPSESAQLHVELTKIATSFRHLPPEPIDVDWKQKTAMKFGLECETLYDCFFDVDGEPLLERIMALACLSTAHELPILFQ